MALPPTINITGTPMTETTRPTSRFFYGWVIVLVGAILTFLGTGFYADAFFVAFRLPNTF